MEDPNQKRLRYLLDRCLDEEETLKERKELEVYLMAEEFGEVFDNEILESFYKKKILVDIIPEKQEQILQAISGIEQDVKPRQNINYWRWIGGIAIFIAILSPFAVNKKISSVYNFSRIDFKEKINGNQQVAHPNKSDLDSRVINNMALLEMADGTRVELDNLAKGKSIEVEGMSLKRSFDGTLILNPLQGSKGSPKLGNYIHSITTPRGSTYKVILSDGTVVHLNADSKLSFPTAFSTKDRRIKFEGEGYFDVAKDPLRPFILTTKDERQEIKVFGTQFIVSAYPNDALYKTTLLEGSVKVKDLKVKRELILEPNQLAILSEQNLYKEEANIEASIAWKNNIFYFAGDNIKNVMNQISRWYDVNIVFEDEIPEGKFWGQISRSKSLHELLDILGKINDFKYTIKGKEVYIMK